MPDEGDPQLLLVDADTHAPTSSAGAPFDAELDAPNDLVRRRWAVIAAEGDEGDALLGRSRGSPPLARRSSRRRPDLPRPGVDERRRGGEVEAAGVRDQRAAPRRPALAPRRPNRDPLLQPLRVKSLRDGGPAERGGLRVGDEIVKIGDHGVDGRRSYLHEGLTRVAPGTSLTLGLADGRTIALVAE